MATQENTQAFAQSEREHSINHLAEINGIARKTAEAMYEMGVHNYADLVDYLSQHTAQQVSVALGEHGVNRPPAFIDQVNWARQANEFGELGNSAAALTAEEIAATEKPEGVPANPNSQEHDATFRVSFDVAADADREPVLRTTVRDGTNGDQEVVFQGADAAPWVSWMLERADLPAAVRRIATGTEAVSAPIPAEPGDARLEIGDVDLSVVGPTSSYPEKRLRAEVSFRLTGTGAEALAAKRTPFRVEGYTVDVESGLSELVASERSQLVPQGLEYVRQQEFGIPDVGHYDFYSIVLLLPPGQLAAYHRGSTVRVVSKVRP